MNTEQINNENLPLDLPPIPEDNCQDVTSLASASVSLVAVEKEVLERQAFAMFEAGILTQDISERMNIRHDQIMAWKKQNNWEMKAIQKHTDYSLVASETNPGAILKQTTGRALRAITNAIKRIDEDIIEGKDLRIQDAKALTEIFATLDKISRLEQGRATDIIDTRTLSYSEAVHIIRQDPFAKNIVKG